MVTLGDLLTLVSPNVLLRMLVWRIDLSDRQQAMLPHKVCLNEDTPYRVWRLDTNQIWGSQLQNQLVQMQRCLTEQLRPIPTPNQHGG